MKIIKRCLRTRVLLSLIIALIYNNLHGQITFNQTIDFSEGDDVGQSIIVLEDGYVLIGNGWGYEVGDYFDEKLKFTKIDLEGNVVWQNVLGESGVSYYCENQSGLITQDGNILFSGPRQTLIESEMYLLKIDPSTGDTVFLKNYNFDDHIYGLQVKEFSNGDLLYSGWDSNDTFGFHFVKLTSDGDIIWVKRYGTNNELNPTNFSIGSNDSIYVINSNNPFLPPGYHYRILDSSGVVTSINTYNTDYLFYGLKSQDQGVYGPGAYFPSPPFQSYVYKANKNGEVQWRYESQIDIDTLTHQELYPGLAKELPNGDFIIMGYYASNFGSRYVGIISKVNSEGISYWERYYTATTDFFNDRINDLALTPDDGFIGVGAGFSETPSEDQNFWVIKFDSLGCMVPGCDTLIIGVMEMPNTKSNILIYPNPVSDEAIIQVAGITSMNSIRILITDMTGKPIFQESISNSQIVATNSIHRFGFSRRSISSGVYLLTIYNNNQTIGAKKIVIL